jgi:hypothetical protein
MLRSHGDSGIYDGIQADVHQGSQCERNESVLPDLAVRREQQVVASVQYIAKHVIMNLMWIAMLFTPIRKIQINWEHQYIFTARPKVVPTSVHHVIEKSIKKSRIIRSAPPKE